MSNPAQSNENILKAEEAVADPRGFQTKAHLQGEAAEILAGSKTQGSMTKNTQESATPEKPMHTAGVEKWSDGVNHGDRYEHQFDNKKVMLPAKDASKGSTTPYPEAQPAYNEQGKLDHIDIKPTQSK